MAEHELKEKRIEIVRNFYAKLDQADASLLDLFAEDVVLFFQNLALHREKLRWGNSVNASRLKSIRSNTFRTRSVF